MNTTIKHVLGCLLYIAPLTSYAVIDTNPGNAQKVNTIHVQKDCAGISNCVSLLQEALDWTWDIRKPSFDRPLLVDIGTGTFVAPSSRAFCSGGGNVTFRGSGRANTVITGGSPGGFANLVFGSGQVTTTIGIRSCTNLAFQDLTVRSERWLDRSVPGSAMGIYWQCSGNSTWTNVDVQATHYGWWDNEIGCGGAVAPTHYWYASKIETKSDFGSTFPYVAAFSENWLYGVELHALHDTASNGVAAAGVSASTGQIQLFGAALRVTMTSGASVVADTGGNTGVGGVVALSGGAIHVHGGIISVNASGGTVNQDIYGARATYPALPGNDGMVHLLETAFTLKPGGNGSTTRISEFVASPFQWPPSVEPPANLTSMNGADSFVETDCDAIGNCDAVAEADKRPHIMIYTDKCTGTKGPWFDSTIGKCKGE